MLVVVEACSFHLSRQAELTATKATSTRVVGRRTLVRNEFIYLLPASTTPSKSVQPAGPQWQLL